MFSDDGWYEFVAIHNSDAVAVKKTGEMLDQLKDYPILDDDRFTQAEEDYYPGIGYVKTDGGDWIPA